MLRGTAKLEVKPADHVYLKDIIQTERGGRVRVNLNDGSILNIGSESQTQISFHNETSQQSDIELYYGKVRAKVVKLERPGSRFEIKTNQAIAGVVGTDEYVDSNPARTRVIFIDGRVCVRNLDPTVIGQECIDGGELTEVLHGRPPIPKRRATNDELIEALTETATLPIGSLVQSSGQIGTEFETLIRGQNLEGASSLLFTRTGVTGEILPGGTATEVPIRIRIAPEAVLGVREYLLSAVGGQLTGTFVVTTAPPPKAVINGFYYFNSVDPPEQIQPPQVNVFQGALVHLDATRSSAPAGQITSTLWSVQGSALDSAQLEWDLDTWLLPPENYTVRLRVGDDQGGAAETRLALRVEALPNPDEVLYSLRQAYETLQPGSYLAFFDPVRFRSYPGLEEFVRNTFQQLSEARVYLRIDNRQVNRDDAIYQATFEITSRSKTAPDILARRVESLTLRLLLERSRDRAFWRIVDYSVSVSDQPGSIITPGITPAGPIAPAGPSTRGAAPQATIELEPASLAFSGVVAGANPPSQTVTLRNTGTSTLDFQAGSLSVPGGWLGVTPARGSLAPGASATLSASVNIAGLLAGEFGGRYHCFRSARHEQPEERSSSPLDRRTPAHRRLTGTTFLQRYGRWGQSRHTNDHSEQHRHGYVELSGGGLKQWLVECQSGERQRARRWCDDPDGFSEHCRAGRQRVRRKLHGLRSPSQQQSAKRNCGPRDQFSLCRFLDQRDSQSSHRVPWRNLCCVCYGRQNRDQWVQWTCGRFSRDCFGA